MTYPGLIPTFEAFLTANGSKDGRYVYQLLQRPVGPTTTPMGHGRAFHEQDVLSGGRGHGSVSYEQPLSGKDIDHYSLIPVTQMAEVVGNVYQEDEITHRVSLTRNQMALQIDSECDGETADQVMSYTEFLEQSKHWKLIK